MRIIDLITIASDHMKNKGFKNPRLEVERLLGCVLGLSRLELYMDFERPVSSEEHSRFRDLYKRRLSHEPLQHLIGTTGFREITVKTDRRALVPRSETELLVEIALGFLEKLLAPRVADIGTGTGVIALSIAYELPESRVVAVDISDEALALAAENTRNLGLEDRVTLVTGNMLEALEGLDLFDAVLSNPPYVRRGIIRKLQPEVKDYDPVIALDGGNDGLDFLKAIAGGAHRFLKPSGLLLLEFGDNQASAIREVISDTGCYSGIDIIRDLTGRERIAKAVRK
jgi:release factor glutamine methyltransferase